MEEVEPDDFRLVGRDLDRDRREHGARRRSGDADRHEHVRLQIHLKWDRKKFQFCTLRIISKLDILNDMSITDWG